MADLGKGFNLSDLRDRIILDEEYGLCPQIQPPETPQFYPSLPLLAGAAAAKAKNPGEEMRLLYVAMTRAGQRLILAGTAGKKSLENKWPSQPPASNCRTYLDWLGPWLLRAGPEALNASGNHPMLNWTFYEENDKRLTPAAAVADVNKTSRTDRAASLRSCKSDCHGVILIHAETAQPAKTSVTTIRRQIADEDGDESHPCSRQRHPSRRQPNERGRNWPGPPHVFAVGGVGPNTDRRRAESGGGALRDQNVFNAEETHASDFGASRPSGNRNSGNNCWPYAGRVERELAFTARFSAADLLKLGWRNMRESARRNLWSCKA